MTTPENEMTAYRFRVDYQKEILEGPLKGMTIQDSCHFATRSAALFFAKQDGCTITPAAGGSAYRFKDARVVCLADLTD